MQILPALSEAEHSGKTKQKLLVEFLQGINFNARFSFSEQER